MELTVELSCNKKPPTGRLQVIFNICPIITDQVIFHICLIITETGIYIRLVNSNQSVGSGSLRFWVNVLVDCVFPGPMGSKQGAPDCFSGGGWQGPARNSGGSGESFLSQG